MDLKKRFTNPFLFDNEPCFQDTQFGYIQNEACDLVSEKRSRSEASTDMYRLST